DHKYLTAGVGNPACFPKGGVQRCVSGGIVQRRALLSGKGVQQPENGFLATRRALNAQGAAIKYNAAHLVASRQREPCKDSGELGAAYLFKSACAGKEQSGPQVA